MDDLTNQSVARRLSLALAACFAVLPALLYEAPLGAATALPICTLFAVALGLATHQLRAASIGRYLLPLIPLLCWLLVSSLWSLDITAALTLAARLWVIAVCVATLISIILRLPLPLVSTIIKAFAIGLVAAEIVVAGDLFLGTPLAIAQHGLTLPAFGPNEYSRGSVFNALLLPSIVVSLWLAGARKLVILCAVAGLAAIGFGSQLSSKLALALATATLLLVVLLPKLRWLLPVAVIAAFALLPLVFPYRLSAEQACWLGAHKPSALHRIYIWNFVSSRIEQHPIIGWGLDAARRMIGGQALVAIRDCRLPLDRPLFMGQLLPLHPHNGVLQIWLELGGIGALLAMMAAIVILMRGLNLGDADPDRQAKIAAAIVAAFAAACLSVGAFSFGLWQEWWLSSVGLGAALVTGCCRLAVAGKAAPHSQEIIV